MEPADIPTVTAEQQRALEQNVFASAKNSEMQLVELRRIAGDVALIKVAAIAAAALLLLLLLR